MSLMHTFAIAMEISTLFFDKVKKIRNKKGYSQEYVASSLNITQSAYSRLESGSSEPTIKQAYQIAQILDTPIHELIPNANFINQHNENLTQCTVIGNIFGKVENMHLSNAIDKMDELKKIFSEFINTVKP